MTIGIGYIEEIATLRRAGRRRTLARRYRRV